jgi:hypothetical protein
MPPIVLLPFARHFGQQLVCTFASPRMLKETIGISHNCWYVGLRHTNINNERSSSTEQGREFLDQPSFFFFFF